VKVKMFSNDNDVVNEVVTENFLSVQVCFSLSLFLSLSSPLPLSLLLSLCFSVDERRRRRKRDDYHIRQT
jgi:hypothetical protein